MLRNSLSCNAEKCVHNVSGLCSANNIRIDGAIDAVGHTSCGTFAERNVKNAMVNMFNINLAGGVKEVLSNGTVEMYPNVICDSVVCKFNDNRICKANHILIRGKDAIDKSMTICETFAY